MSKDNFILVIQTHDNFIGKCYRLDPPQSIHGANFLKSRLYETEAEAQIAAGLANIRVQMSDNNLDYNEFDELLKSMLRLANSKKVWSNE